MRTIKANVNLEKGKLDRYFSACIGAGRAAEVMRYIPMQQLKKMQEECPFRYIRFHGLFHEEMNIVHRNGDGSLAFCFQYVDLLFDSLLEANIRPIVELGLMPEIMAKEQAYVFWWKMNKSMPKDIGEWEALIEALLRHLTYRYGEEEVKTWYFEVWNEPNHPGFFTEYQNMDAYFELYDAASRAVKRVNSAYRVGGPATAGMQWIGELIAHCKEKNVALDFITSHSYGIKGDFDPDGTAIVYLPNIDKVSNEIRYHGKYCHEEGLPLIITEWSSSFSHTDPIHDSYYNAPYLLRAIKRSEGYADMFSYWTYTDIFEENSPPTMPFHGGFGMINVQSIPKPTYYAYCFLHKLGDTEIICEDEDAYVCKSEKSVQVLFWNIKCTPEKTDNRKHFGRDLKTEVLPDATVTLEGLIPNKEYTVTRETIGYRMGDAYTAYLDMHLTELPTREETADLIEKAKPQKTVFTVTADENGMLSFPVSQTENEADLLIIA
jgi:xylan 1,4-beta-xylosidase